VNLAWTPCSDYHRLFTARTWVLFEAPACDAAPTERLQQYPSSVADRKAEADQRSLLCWQHSYNKIKVHWRKFFDALLWFDILLTVVLWKSPQQTCCVKKCKSKLILKNRNRMLDLIFWHETFLQRHTKSNDKKLPCWVWECSLVNACCCAVGSRSGQLRLDTHQDEYQESVLFQGSLFVYLPNFDF